MSERAARYPPTLMGTVCVPWDEQYRFLEALFRDQVRLLVAAGYQDLYVFGTAGEGHAVDEGQFDAIGRAFHDELTRAGLPARVGIISLSLSTVIGRIERALSWGVRRFQVSLPSWGALNNRELALFFRETCGRFPDAQFMHYNLRRAGRLITPPEYARLAEGYPNLVATKHGGVDAMGTIDRLQRQAPQLQHFFGERGFAYASLRGECGLLISIASANLRAGQEFYQAGRRGDQATLLSVQAELGELTEALHALVGDRAHIDGAFDKLFCRLHDPRFPLRLRPPHVGVDEAVFEEFRELLRTRFPRWLSGAEASPGGTGAPSPEGAT
jgi:dihydrodipicolinate synthase/N-acetylneuraminate lyase